MDFVIGVSRYDEGMAALPFRARRFFKWVTLGACFLITALWVAGWRWSFGYSTTRWTVAVGSGVVALATGRPGTFHGYPLYKLNTVELPRQARGMSWRPYYTSFAPSPGFGMFIPLWMVFLPVALLTAMLWRHDPRSLPGHCRGCGYNLTGNVSGVCPECGQPAGGPNHCVNHET